MSHPNRFRRLRRPMTAAAALAALLLVLTACGEAGSEPTATTTTMPVAEGPVVVTATDYAFVGLPERVAAGTMLTLENESTAEVHELVAFRLPDDEIRSVAELVQLPEAELAAFFQYLETVVIAPPGETGFPVEGTGVLTQPGRYAVICAIPTGAIPADYLAAAAEAEGGPPDVAGGPPHFVNGMFGEITVTG